MLLESIYQIENVIKIDIQYNGKNGVHKYFNVLPN